MLHFACPRCKFQMEAPDAEGGTKIACPNCPQRLQVPMPPPSKTVLAPLVGHTPTTLQASQPPEATPVIPPGAIIPVAEHDNDNCLCCQAQRLGDTAQPGVIPPFICPRVFNPGQHHIEFDTWTAAVVKVEKTVKAFLTGGGGDGYIYPDAWGRTYGSFSSDPIETHHTVEYDYWVRDASGREKRLYIPEKLAAREGQSLIFVCARPKDSDAWRRVAIVNHATGEYLYPSGSCPAELLIDPVPDLIERDNLTTQHRVTVAIAVFGCLLGLCGFVLCLFGWAGSNRQYPGEAPDVGLMVASLVFLAMAGAAWYPLCWLLAHVDRRYKPWFEQCQRNRLSLIHHCRSYCDWLAVTRRSP
jgi:hypothetical protein